MTALNDAGIDYESINYIIEPPSRSKLAELTRKMGTSPRSLLRVREPEYRSLGLDDETLSDDAILDALAEHPSLIQRPILEYGDRAALTRPAERVGEIVADWGLGSSR